MKYREQLNAIKTKRDNYIKFRERTNQVYGHLQSNIAKEYTNTKDEAILKSYDKEIDRLQPLADKELEEYYYNKAIESLTPDSKELQSILSNGIQEALKSLELDKI